MAGGRHGRRAHDHDVGGLGLAQDGVADVGGLADGLLHLAVGVLADEMGQGPLRLRSNALGDAAWHEVQGHDLRLVAVGQGVGEAQRQLGVRAAADRHEDAADLRRAALLDHRDVARRVANDLVDGRREDRCLGSGPGRRGLAAPAEDDQVGVEFRRRLDDALGGAPPDANDRMDRDAFGGVVEDSLQQPAGLAGLRRALAQRRFLRDLHDPEDGQHARPAVHQRSADPHQLLGGQRVGNRDQDP